MWQKRLKAIDHLADGVHVTGSGFDLSSMTGPPFIDGREFQLATRALVRPGHRHGTLPITLDDGLVAGSPALVTMID